MSQPVRIALLGCGGVGSEVYRLLGQQAADLAARIGAPLEVAGVAVRRPGRARAVPVDPALLTSDAMALATRPDVDIVVEVIGGIEPARSLLLAAMKNGKSVVSANKALLAEDGGTLHQAARDARTDLYYEAAVGGAIPLLRPLRESLAGDAVRRVLGIVNGTTNYILDPTADIEGFDAAAKGAILASLAFHSEVPAAGVFREGITGVTQADIASARTLGHVVKLLAICERNEAGVSVRVHPAMIPRSHPLAGVREAYNAVFVEAESAGRLMFYGAGAGGQPTASAVLGDIVAVARNQLAGTRGPDATSIDCHFLFEPYEIEQPGFDPLDTVEFWDLVNRQDWAICEAVQQGISARVHERGYYAPMEDYNLDIRRYVLERIGGVIDAT